MNNMNNMNNIEKQNVLNVYNEIAEHFDDTRAYKWSWIEEFIEQNNLKNSNKKVIDIGCGSGRNLLPHFIGIDNSTKFINICLNKGLTVIASDMCDIPLLDEKYDAILSIASFHHLSDEERRIKALKEMKRLIKPNGEGKILLSVWSINQPLKTRRTFKYGDVIVPWNKNGKIYERYYHIFNIKKLKLLFEIVGLKIIDYKWDCGNEIFILTK